MPEPLVNLSPPADAAVFLFAAPWMKSSWPALGIGCLKSFLARAGISARCCHFHLEAAAAVGWDRYDDFAETWGAGEALFGALLDPDDGSRLVTVAARLLRDAARPDAACWAENNGREDLRAIVEAWLDRERPERYAVVGGSVGAMQLTSTLYLMKRIRERGHTGVRVLGGSGLVGSVARTVLDRSPAVDAVIDGEGEQAMVAVVQRAMSGSPGLAGLPRVISRDQAGSQSCCEESSLNIAAAPSPDLDEFYDAAARLGIPRTALKLSVEYSRGCEWEHRTPGALRGCTFCGLYRNSPDHRRKPAKRVLHEINEAIQRYRVLNLAFVDAYLPQGYREELLQGLIRLPIDIALFTEMRCDLTTDFAGLLAACAERIQLGVESFSSAILRRIGKGLTAARTVYSVRVCQEYGIPLQYNLMTRIPGVPTVEIEQLHELLPSLFGLAPPSLSEFYLDRNSLMFADPSAYGIARECCDAVRPEWLATSLGDGRVSQVVPFVFDDSEAECSWHRVAQQVTRWKERWRLAQTNGLPAPLIWRDGGGWASIIDARDETMHVYTLEGVLYELFTACTQVTTEKELSLSLPKHPHALIHEALEHLVCRRLVLQDGAQWVSLPVRAGIPALRRSVV